MADKLTFGGDDDLPQSSRSAATVTQTAADDLIERLRSHKWEDRYHRELRDKAANEIERLRAEVERAMREIAQRGEEVERLRLEVERGTQIE